MPANISTSSAAHRTYSFGEFTLDLDRGALLRAGADIKLRPKSFEVLRYLIEHQGLLVTKDELLDAIWGQTIVTEDSVTHCLIDIRKALHDQLHEMIRTVPRRGYIFELPVTKHGDPAMASGVPSRSKFATSWPGWRLAAALVLMLGVAAVWWEFGNRRVEIPAIAEPLSIVAPHSIAVLPFVNMSDDPGNEYFSEGISEEILNLLTKVPELRVTSRSSAFSFKGQNLDIPTIAAKLNVAHVLDGSVRKSGDQLRINAQLIEVATDTHLWSETYDRDLTDIFAIQTEIANAIVAALRETIEIEAAGEISVLAATSNMNAYDLFLESRELFLARTDLERSVALSEQAVALDPGFARAWEGLAAIYGVLPDRGFSDRDYHDLALEAAQTALELDDGLSLAHSVIGLVYQTRHPYRWEESLEHFRLAAKNGNMNATNFLFRAVGYMRLGYFELAMVDLDQCLSIDPQYANCHRHKAMLHLLFGEREKAIALLLSMLENGVPGVHSLFVSALALSGNRAAALLLADRVTSRTGAPIKYWIDLIEDPDIARPEALEALDRWIESENIDVNRIEPMMIAFGAYDRTTFKSNRVFFYSIWLPEFATFRQSPHFKIAVSESGMLAFWRLNGFPPQCRPVGDDDFECD